MRRPPPLDPRRRALAEALGHLLGDLVWQEVVRAGPQDEDGGTDVDPRKDGARRLAGCDADAVEVNRAKIRRAAA